MSNFILAREILDIFLKRNTALVDSVKYPTLGKCTLFRNGFQGIASKSRVAPLLRLGGSKRCLLPLTFLSRISESANVGISYLILEKLYLKKFFLQMFLIVRKSSGKKIPQTYSLEPKTYLSNDISRPLS